MTKQPLCPAGSQALHRFLVLGMLQILPIIGIFGLPSGLGGGALRPCRDRAGRSWAPVLCALGACFAAAFAPTVASANSVSEGPPLVIELFPEQGPNDQGGVTQMDRSSGWAAPWILGPRVGVGGDFWLQPLGHSGWSRAVDPKVPRDIPSSAGSGHRAPPSTVLTTPAAPGRSPMLYVGGRPWRRVQLFFGSVPLSDMLTLREALRVMPPGLVADWRLLSPFGAAHVFSESRDFYPALVFDPCQPKACTGYEPGSRPDTATGTRIEGRSETGRSNSLHVGQSFVPAASGLNSQGFSEAPQALWSYWGAEVLHDSGGARVRDLRNTVLDTSDDRWVSLRNSDWSRFAAAHSSAWLWPSLATKGELSFLSSRVDEGLSLGAQDSRATPRSFMSFGAIEARSETLVPGDGARLVADLRAAWTESWAGGLDSVWQESRLRRYGLLGAVGVAAVTPYRRLALGLRQTRIGMDVEQVSTARRETPPEGGPDEAVTKAREQRVVARGGLALGLGRWQGVDVQIALATRTGLVTSTTRAACPAAVRAQGLCPEGGRESVTTPASWAATLAAEWPGGLLWSAFAQLAARQPAPTERFGSGLGSLANATLLPEERLLVGTEIALPFALLRYERAREFKAIVPERAADGRVRFVNDSATDFNIVTTRIAPPTGGSKGLFGAGYLEYRLAYAVRRAGRPRDVPNYPRHSVEGFASTNPRPFAELQAGKLTWSVQARADVRDFVAVDRANLMYERPLMVWEPGLGVGLVSPRSRFELGVGTRLAGRFGSQKQAAGPARLPDSRVGSADDWEPESDEPNVVVRLRGDF